MGLVDRLKRRFGKSEPLPPDVERAIHDRVQTFVRESFGTPFCAMRDNGFTQQAAADASIAALRRHLATAARRDGTMGEIAGAVGLEKGADAGLGERIREAVEVELEQTKLMALLIDELVVLERDRPSRLAASAASIVTDETIVTEPAEALPAEALPGENGEDIGEITDDDLLAIRDFWSAMAKTWWEAEQRSTADCDYCGISISSGRGYLSGASLLCTACMERDLMATGLTNLKRDAEYYGAGVLQSARAARRERAEQ